MTEWGIMYPMTHFIIDGEQYTIHSSSAFIVTLDWFNAFVKLGIVPPIFSFVRFKVINYKRVIMYKNDIQQSSILYTQSTTHFNLHPTEQKTITNSTQNKTDQIDTEWHRMTYYWKVVQILQYSEAPPPPGETKKGCVLAIGLMVIPMALYVAGLLV